MRQPTIPIGASGNKATAELEVGGFVSHVPNYISSCVVEAYGVFEAAEGGDQYLNAAKLFVISRSRLLRTPRNTL